MPGSPEDVHGLRGLFLKHWLSGESGQGSKLKDHCSGAGGASLADTFHLTGLDPVAQVNPGKWQVTK